MPDRLRHLEEENARLRATVEEHRRAEESMRESEEKFRKITASANDAIIMRDSTGNITFWNKAAEKIFGYSAAEALDRKLPLLLAEPEAECDGSSVYELAAASLGQGKTMLVTARRKDGLTLPVELSMSTARYRGKWNVISILRDVSHRREAETALRLAKEEAEKLSRLQSEFINSVSHEMRTPLTSIRGFARIVQVKLENAVFPALENAPPPTAKAVQQIRHNMGILVAESQRLTAMINDVLDLAALQQNNVEWTMASVDMAHCVRRALESAEGLCNAKGLRLTADIEPGLPPVVCDRAKILQVLINLISNAVKFTDQGAVVCSVRGLDQAVRVCVADSGPGIPPDQLGHIFKSFRQLGDSLTDKPKGTGMGLAICKEITDYHGGRIWAQSTLGQGSTFCLELPLRPAMPLPLEPDAPLGRPAREDGHD